MKRTSIVDNWVGTSILEIIQEINKYEAPHWELSAAVTNELFHAIHSAGPMKQKKFLSIVY